MHRLQQLHQRYATYSANPGRSVRFLKNLLADAFPERALAEAAVVKSFARETGLPLVLLDDAVPLDLDATREWFAQRVIGQPEAVTRVLDLLAMTEARLARPGKPLASLLLIGHTGTGKTEMAKALATFLFGDAARLARFDLNEFSDPASVQRLMGGLGKGSRHDALADWLFYPALEEITLELRLELKSDSHKCRVFFVGYQALERKLYFTPLLPEVHFELLPGQTLAERATAVLTQHFRQQEKEGWADLKARGSGGKMRLTTLEIELDPPARAKVPQPATRALLFGGLEKKDGDVELRKTGRALHELYPDDLHRAVDREPEVAELARLLVGSDRRPIVLPPERRAEFKTLFAVAEPLLHDAGRQKPTSAAFGREPLVQQLAQKLTRERTSLRLVGPSGVGKSTALLHAVRTWFQAQPDAGDDDDEFATAPGSRKHRFWRGNGGRLIAGMRYLGEWEERCETFISQLGGLAGVFCAENLLELVQVGGDGPGNSVAAFFLPYLQRGELRVIAEATGEEVEACRRLLPGLLDVFQIVRVPEFADREAVAVLDRLAGAYAATTRTEFERVVPALVHRLFQRFQPYAVFPGPAARFLRGLFDGTAKGKAVTGQGVMAAFVTLTGLPEVFLRDELTLAWETVCAAFAARVIGQAEAVAAAAGLVVTIKAGLGDPGRPFGVLLCCGPTGVGKTELVKTLAGYCFGAAGAKDRLVRLDMSEYSGWGAARRWLEDPQGAPAAWLERVRRQPFCVVLLDEIEQAAPEVFDVLLGLLDEGRMTDRFGRVTQFRSAVMVLTSNLGAQAGRALGFVPDAGPDYESAVAKHFRPEFFNRLDAVVTFRALAAADVAAIARKELAELAAREGFAAANLRLEWPAELVAAVASAGYDPRYGARPLQRVLEQMVSTPLARWRLANPTLRDATLRLGLDSAGALTVQVQRPGPASPAP